MKVMIRGGNADSDDSDGANDHRYRCCLHEQAS